MAAQPGGHFSEAPRSVGHRIACIFGLANILGGGFVVSGVVRVDGELG